MSTTTHVAEPVFEEEEAKRCATKSGLVRRSPKVWQQNPKDVERLQTKQHPSDQKAQRPSTHGMQQICPKSGKGTSSDHNHILSGDVVTMSPIWCKGVHVLHLDSIRILTPLLPSKGGPIHTPVTARILPSPSGIPLP